MAAWWFITGGITALTTGASITVAIHKRPEWKTTKSPRLNTVGFLLFQSGLRDSGEKIANRANESGGN